MSLRSGIPYWLIKNGLLRTYPPLPGDAVCDLAILGGGITGALLAQRLSQAGIDVVVLDKREIGQGSTCASTCLIQYELDVELTELAEKIGEADAARCFRLSYEAVEELKALIATLEDSCEFRSRPALYLASTKNDVQRLVGECELRARHGFNVEWWSAARLREDTRFRQAHGAIFSRGDGEVDGFRLTHALFDLAQRQGARVYDRTEVTKIEPSESHVTLHTARGQVRARRVAFATGYESAEHLPKRVGRLKSTYALITEPAAPLTGWPEQCLVWESARPYGYMRSGPEGRVIIGGEDTPFKSDHRSERLLARKVLKLEDRLAEWFPDAGLETAYAWAGTFGETDDGLPYIGSHAKLPWAYFAMGYGGNGFTFGVLAARLITDLHLGRPTPDLPLFRFDR